MSKPVCIITAHCHPWLIDQLNRRFTVRYEPLIGYEALLAAMPQAVGLIVTTRLKIDARLMDAGPALQWIGRLGSGLELIDTQYAEARGIAVASSPEGNRNAVAEHALGMVLGLLHRQHTAANQIKNGQWLRSENRGTELRGKTVGVIGYGNTGSQLAKLLQPFEVTVLAYDNGKHDFASGHVREASLEQVCKYAHVVSFHVPLNPQSRHMANAHLFAQMEQRPLLVNTSRGEVVHTTDLIGALKAGQLSGAALDVLENERLETYSAGENEALQWLLQQPQVLITPHIAGYSHEAFLQMAQVLFQKLFTPTPH
jgi:D-3-phosphoglycerate dehydrogenase / 2-oxoglutarate reductase